MIDGVTCPRCGSVYSLPSAAARIEGRSFACVRDGAVLVTRRTVGAHASDLATLHDLTRRMPVRTAAVAHRPIAVGAAGDVSGTLGPVSH